MISDALLGFETFSVFQHNDPELAASNTFHRKFTLCCKASVITSAAHSKNCKEPIIFNILFILD